MPQNVQDINGVLTWYENSTNNSTIYNGNDGLHLDGKNFVYFDSSVVVTRGYTIGRMANASSLLDTTENKWNTKYSYIKWNNFYTYNYDSEWFYNKYISNYTNNDDSCPNGMYSVITKKRILCAEEIDIYSDKRIKQNICEIPKEFALNTIRKLVPCTYNYKDVVNKGTRTNYGFIAQEVDEILPSVVEKSADFIPNIYEVANISENRITLSNFSTKDLLTQETNLKIKMFNHENKEFIVTLKEIIDDKTFSIQESILEVSDNKIFVYGQQVDDMHSLEKNAIFSITSSAVKYMDIELQEAKRIVEKRQQEIDNLKNELKNLKDFIKTTIK